MIQDLINLKSKNIHVYALTKQGELNECWESTRISKSTYKKYNDDSRFLEV